MLSSSWFCVELDLYLIDSLRVSSFSFLSLGGAEFAGERVGGAAPGCFFFSFLRTTITLSWFCFTEPDRRICSFIALVRVQSTARSSTPDTSVSSVASPVAARPTASAETSSAGAVYRNLAASVMALACSAVSSLSKCSHKRCGALFCNGPNISTAVSTDCKRGATNTRSKGMPSRTRRFSAAWCFPRGVSGELSQYSPCIVPDSSPSHSPCVIMHSSCGRIISFAVSPTFPLDTRRLLLECGVYGLASDIDATDVARCMTGRGAKNSSTSWSSSSKLGSEMFSSSSRWSRAHHHSLPSIVSARSGRVEGSSSSSSASFSPKSVSTDSRACELRCCEWKEGPSDESIMSVSSSCSMRVLVLRRGGMAE
mmetsp:Transcript_18989/g.45539  ORF Transcript_18989/g.45539 Transcript_18989/m.45539 type:complete len:368 (+) Transcript_18989:403-1506(+)